MWPTQGYPSATAGGWSALDRRARTLALVAMGALALAVSAATWLSMRPGQPSTPVYGNGSSAPAALWSWDGAGYRLVPSAGAGPYSNDADMAYDRARGVLVLWDHGCGRLVMGFTGGCIDQVNQTWTWDGTRWTSHSSKSAPTEVGPGAMVYDSRVGQVVYVNGVGQAWSWAGTQWLPMALNGAPRVPRRDSASAPATFAVGYDEGRDLLVFVLSSGTWSWDGRRWAESGGGIDFAEARPDAHLVYDRARGQLVYVGSRFTWTWDGTRWQPHEQAAVASGTVAYDPVGKTVMLVQQDTSACDRIACRTTTWRWDSKSWTELATDRVPVLPLTRSGAFDPPMAFDEAGAVMVLFASAN
jgi:hypothetical protein